MLQSELSEQKRLDVYHAYQRSIAKFGDSARFVSKSTLFDEAMRMSAPRFYVTYERAARIISSFRKGNIPDMSNPLKMEMYRDIYRLFVEKTDGKIKSLRGVLEMEAPSFYIDKRHFARLIRQSLKHKTR
ncbi:hypothetical protein JQM84_06715 [Parabacteroides distasonis]|nr:hypothetical protein [Parabacteroides distasonis]